MLLSLICIIKHVVVTILFYFLDHMRLIVEPRVVIDGVECTLLGMPLETITLVFCTLMEVCYLYAMVAHLRCAAQPL